MEAFASASHSPHPPSRRRKQRIEAPETTLGHFWAGEFPMVYPPVPSNMAKENILSIANVPSQTSFHRGFSIAKLD